MTIVNEIDVQSEGKLKTHCPQILFSGCSVNVYYDCDTECFALATEYVCELLMENVWTSMDTSGLQLLGITCFFIACKFDDFNHPAIEEMLWISDSQYTTR